MEKQITTSVWSYIVGFVSAVVLTLVAYVIIVNHMVTGTTAVASISALAVIQFIVQLVFFLHLGKGKSGRWNLAAFAFMLITLGIVVTGSLWIMYNLNYNMMTPGQMNSYMQEQSNEGF